MKTTIEGIEYTISTEDDDIILDHRTNPLMLIDGWYNLRMLHDNDKWLAQYYLEKYIHENIHLATRWAE